MGDFIEVVAVFQDKFGLPVHLAAMGRSLDKKPKHRVIGFQDLKEVYNMAADIIDHFNL